jgi:hypothetical protein
MTKMKTTSADRLHAGKRMVLGPPSLSRGRLNLANAGSLFQAEVVATDRAG